MTDSTSPKFDPAQDEAGHEPLAVNTRSIVISMISLGVLLVFALFLASQLMNEPESETTNSESTTPSWNVSPDPPTPRVTPEQAKKYREMLADQKAQLAETRLLDSKNNIAQIPLDRAMQLLESEGLEAFERLTGGESNAGSNSPNKESEN